MFHQRELRQEIAHLIQRVNAIENAHERGHLIEQIFAIAHQRVHQEFLLEELVHRRRLRAAAAQPGVLDDRHLRRPIRSPAHAVHRDTVPVDFRPRLCVINHLRQQAIGRFTHLDRILPGARTIDRKNSNSERQNRTEAFSQVFLAAIQAVHRDHQRDRSFRILRQAQVADDFLAFKRNVNDFQRWIVETRMCQKCLDGFFVGALLTRRRRNGPASEGVKSPRADVIGVRLGGIRLFQ